MHFKMEVARIEKGTNLAGESSNQVSLIEPEKEFQENPYATLTYYVDSSESDKLRVGQILTITIE
jgi:hypothetical protein